jgi:hypothetical protein
MMEGMRSCRHWDRGQLARVAKSGTCTEPRRWSGRGGGGGISQVWLSSEHASPQCTMYRASQRSTCTGLAIFRVHFTFIPHCYGKCATRPYPERSMIIFGTRSVQSVKARGEFHCPHCSDRVGYCQKQARRFFTLYFIPIIPLDSIGDFVECLKCSRTYRSEVLAFDPNTERKAIRAEFEHAMRRALLCLSTADDVVDDRELDAIASVCQSIGEASFSREELRAEVDSGVCGLTQTTEYLSSLAPRLNDSGKELVIRASLTVAAADENLDDQEFKVIALYARALEMSESHFAGVIRDAASD